MATQERKLAELVEQFQGWIQDAAARGESEPEAMSLATSDSDGMPSVRMVLLKHADERGFVFYTNLGSQKGQELAANAQAALCFHWKTTARQVRVQGAVEPVSAAEADAYFASRARDSRIGAWASKQSQPMHERFELEKRVAQQALRFHVGSIPRPEFWSGFRVLPRCIEFWEAKPFRLHERVRYVANEAGLWQGQTLFP